MADKYVVKQGSQPCFSSDDLGVCEAVVSKKKMELLNQGCDIRHPEFAMSISENESLPVTI